MSFNIILLHGTKLFLYLLGCNHTHHMKRWPTATDRVVWSVCVCQLVMTVNPAKTAKLTKMPVWLSTCPKKTCRAHMAPQKGTLLKGTCLAVDILKVTHKGGSTCRCNLLDMVTCSIWHRLPTFSALTAFSALTLLVGWQEGL